MFKSTNRTILELKHTDVITSYSIHYTKLYENPPAVKYYEVPPGYEGGLEHVAELASVPFQSIEELTGISFDAFPDFWDLSQEQCGAISYNFV